MVFESLFNFKILLRVAGDGPVNLIKILKLFRFNPIKFNHDYPMELHVTILLFGPTPPSLYVMLSQLKHVTKYNLIIHE